MVVFMQEFYAHTDPANPGKLPEDGACWQTLEDHLENTAQLARDYAEGIGAGGLGYIAGLLHDLGKYTRVFQDYLKRSVAGEGVTRGEVIHALQGAKFANEAINDSVITDIICNVIATHHGGLFDSITDGQRTLICKTDKSENKLHYEEARKEFNPSINEAELKTEILNFCNTSQSKDLNPFFMLHFLTKAVYSCVVDADRCNSAGLEINDTRPDWVELIQQLDAYLTSFTEDSDIDRVRKSISEQCREGGGRQQGIYTLSVPTGGGKTLSSLRFALAHAQKHNLKRIIYVIPYLSILDQTASKMHDVFADDSGELILEHHSNIELPENDDDEVQYRLLTSRWDSPIVLTTMVQFLETVYSNRASKLRKFHNMSESVLIFDEIQALPIKCVHLFNEVANFLHTFGKSTILLCTATQPHLHKTERPVRLSDNPDIVNITSDDLKIFERVSIEDKTQSEMDHEQIAELVKNQIEQDKSTLVILNTKGDARQVYEQCKKIECEKAFLTTDLCPAHRLSILDRLRDNLKPETRKLTLCVSTQLIEVGVDVSFDCVIRAQAGMDSIIQAAGRCNRNRENATPQSVFVVNIQDEKLAYLPEIQEGKSVTERVFHENQNSNLLSEKVISQFYDYYFYAQKNKMDYSVHDGHTTIYSLLNDNPLGTAAYQNRNNKNYTGLPCAFQTAAEAFSVIDGSQVGVVVPYGDALKLINKFENDYSPKDKMRIMKQLQKYTVSVYSDVLIKLDYSERAIERIDDTFYLLSPDYYDAKEYGLRREAMFSLLNA
ncbi:MAG: CRISPR-associated helicase Cas3' [Sedimentisphaerales bacterium]|nr:CRISPR-associated helicase Cas3' [Sedimentisphaerales bacterium]